MTRSYTWIWEKTKEAELSELIGKTLSKIEINEDKTEIFFTTEEGNQYLMYHSQNCCESVQLEEVYGDFSDLIGSPILQAEEVTNHDMFNGKPEYPDSWTWTFYKLATVKGYVTLRWLGESNGYYSESVDFAEIKETPMTDDLAGEVGTRVDYGKPIIENAEKIRRIRLDTDQENPVIKEYVEAVKKGMTMQNEPQLSAEMEKRFDEEFGYLSVAIDYYVENAYPFRKESGMKHLEEIKHFLATALEEQRQGYIAEVDKLESGLISAIRKEGYLQAKLDVIAILNGKGAK